MANALDWGPPSQGSYLNRLGDAPSSTFGSVQALGVHHRHPPRCPLNPHSAPSSEIGDPDSSCTVLIRASRVLLGSIKR